jgi:hypothetical protein
MTARLLGLLLVASTLSTACATETPFKSATRPPDAQCETRPECDVPVDPLNGMVAENMIMSRGRTTVLKWTLAGHGGRYRWDGAGIVFENAANGVIRCARNQSGPVRTCTNNGGTGSTGGKFKYDVRVLDNTTGQILVLDPFVVNR